MTEVCALASGSNGNCYYVGNSEEAVIIDAGVSRRKIIERLKARGLNPLKIKAVFITHEHSDHYRGAKIFSKKNGYPRVHIGTNPAALPLHHAARKGQDLCAG